MRRWGPESWDGQAKDEVWLLSQRQINACEVIYFAIPLIFDMLQQFAYIIHKIFEREKERYSDSLFFAGE